LARGKLMSVLKAILFVLICAPILKAQGPVEVQDAVITSVRLGSVHSDMDRVPLISASAATAAEIRRIVRSPEHDPKRVSMADASWPPNDPAINKQVIPARPKAFTYTHAYEVRARIHKTASYATLPLFVAEAIVGQKLFNQTQRSESLRSAHSALAAGTAVLFGVNSVTGVWNLWEARKNSSGKAKRLFHGILMLGADAGFVATGALAPGEEDHGGPRSGDRASTHRVVALTSMGVATISYLFMLLAR
jgi:hypothetical protein